MSDPFAGIADPPPAVAAAEAEALVEARYGRRVTARALLSERDCNFLVSASDGWRAVLKIAATGEAPEVTDFQVQAMLYLEGKDPSLPVPAIVRDLDGEAAFDHDFSGATHRVRLVSFLEGQPFEPAAADAALLADLGAVLARLDIALEEFSHPGDLQPLLWDMRRAPEVAALVDHIVEPVLRARVARTLAAFEAYALERFDALPAQVIHNDANPANLLVDPASNRIAGVIDFGDMLRLPRIVEPAVAASYLRRTDDDPLGRMTELLQGYQRIRPLGDDELFLLPLLVMTRLATTVAILAWRESIKGPDDAYLVDAQASEAKAGIFLAQLEDLGWQRAGERLCQALAPPR